MSKPNQTFTTYTGAAKEQPVPAADVAKVSEAVKQEASKPEVARLLPIKLRRGYWPHPGEVYFDAEGNEVTVPDEKDEAARRRHKLQPGTRMLLTPKRAKPLVDAGKAELDVGI